MRMGSGQLTLTNGTATVAVPRIATGAVVHLTAKSLLGTVGALRYSITPGVGFSVTSVSVLDQSIVGWTVDI